MKKPKGFKTFDGLMRKLVKVPPAELPEPCPSCHGKGFYVVYPRGSQRPGQKILCHCGDEQRAEERKKRK